FESCFVGAEPAAAHSHERQLALKPRVPRESTANSNQIDWTSLRRLDLTKRRNVSAARRTRQDTPHCGMPQSCSTPRRLVSAWPSISFPGLGAWKDNRALLPHRLEACSHR